jgi:hypothetical protein
MRVELLHAAARAGKPATNGAGYSWDLLGFSEEAGTPPIAAGVLKSSKYSSLRGRRQD